MNNFNNNISDYFNFTPISNIFIEKYMLKANSTFVIIYIFLLNKVFKNEIIKISTSTKELDILESDIIKCLEFWEQKNLIKYNIENDILNISFLSLNEDTKVKLIVQKEKSFSEKDINFYSNQEEIKQLFRLVENKLAKTLSYQDRAKIIELYEGYGMSTELFAVLLTYCKEKNKTNFNYIEKVALDWCENGIDSPEKAEEYTKSYDEKYKKILNRLGIKSEPAPEHINYMKYWLNDMKMPLELIEKACDITVLAIGKPSFAYVNKIILDWNNKNIRTLSQVEEENSKFKIEIEQKNEQLKSKNQKLNYKNNHIPIAKDKFVNYEQPNLDFKKLREYEIKSLKGEI